MRLNDWWRRLRSRFLTLRAASHRHFGNQYGDKESYWNAIGDLTHALQLHTGNVEALVMRGTIYWRELDHADRAVRDLTEAIERDPARWDALFNRALARQQVGDLAGAVIDLQRYVNEAPSSSWTSAAERLLGELSALLQSDASRHPGPTASATAPDAGVPDP
jgi:regulator of sirC expression with transglutaminase-like and TPR domain